MKRSESASCPPSERVARVASVGRGVWASTSNTQHDYHVCECVRLISASLTPRDITDLEKNNSVYRFVFAKRSARTAVADHWAKGSTR
ncbi:uncharacterized protein FOMMEDRAFT_23043 [Fomitiporia mediterranea MF3/22]|uniref:uncharacterized protein n=1 Tax=Fomitiporia mediterranea (strain MF3/22) TaxID=694068 RepID=UPI00044080F4|nr:uncharacterized protein FOMMEDRAFT_23043 [Fomitiporia mediterranea MF3/22]EJC99133.1 hypothetical protein FOMMEDRAFT_23043 [Fomitiporia mediterranea MF3/22]